jgi:hypothetical protein
MTFWLPPLIKPDGRFSRIRLSEFQVRVARSYARVVGIW